MSFWQGTAEFAVDCSSSDSDSLLNATSNFQIMQICTSKLPSAVWVSIPFFTHQMEQ